MSTSDRQMEILELLKRHSFLTVNQLSELLYSSPSSIRRDLTYLQNHQYVKRTHGGATMMGAESLLTLEARMNIRIAQKKLIAKKAAELLEDGMSVFLDSSSTASFLVPYIAQRKDITLFTTNLRTAVAAIDAGIKTHCLGGFAANGTTELSGPWTYDIIKTLKPDILFFSSYGLSLDGEITDPTMEENHLRHLALKQAKQKVFLCDSGKIGKQALYHLTALDHIDCAVFDRDTPELPPLCPFL